MVLKSYTDYINKQCEKVIKYSEYIYGNDIPEEIKENKITHCKNCGAPLKSHTQNNCEYCGVIIIK